MRSKERRQWLQRLHEWRVAHVSDRMFVLVLALLVGFFAAVAAFSLHWIINQIVMLLTSSFEKSRANWLYLVYPVVGIYPWHHAHPLCHLLQQVAYPFA